MTKITFYNSDNGVIRGFDCRNHTGFAEEGSDIVCAAVSVLVINTINSIETFTDAQLEVQTEKQNAQISARISGEPDEKAQLLMKSLILGLQGIEENEEYAAFIDLIFEEV